MAKAKDLTGLIFGRLTVIGREGTSANGSAIWRCCCTCGNIKEATTAHLKGGFIKSCGCLKAEVSAKNCIARIKHGAKTRKEKSVFTRLYSVWRNMKDRCDNPNCHAYEDYGVRGITVCNEWHDDFSVFRDWALANGYDPNAPYGQCTIDRKDNDKGYCPENCRWISMAEQAHNRRNGHRRNGQFAKAGEQNGST